MTVLRFGSSPTRANRRPGWALAFAVTFGFASAASAQQADNPLHDPVKSVMKLMGFATDAPQPQDFVLKTRPQKEPDYINVFQPPPEPSRPVLKDKELGDLKANLDWSRSGPTRCARASLPPPRPSPMRRRRPRRRKSRRRRQITSRPVCRATLRDATEP